MYLKFIVNFVQRQGNKVTSEIPKGALCSGELRRRLKENKIEIDVENKIDYV